MALDAKGAAPLALHRFGFGPRAGSIDAVPAAPRVSEERRKGGAAVATPMEPPKVDDATMAAVPPPAEPATPNPPAQNRNREIKARTDAAMGAEIGFAERLVWFWSNHFCVSAD